MRITWIVGARIKVRDDSADVRGIFARKWDDYYV